MEALYAYLLQRTDPDRFLCLAPAEFVRLDAIFLPSGKDSFGFIADCGVSLDDTKVGVMPASCECVGTLNITPFSSWFLFSFLSVMV